MKIRSASTLTNGYRCWKSRATRRSVVARRPSGGSLREEERRTADTGDPIGVRLASASAAATAPGACMGAMLPPMKIHGVQLHLGEAASMNLQA